MPYSPIRTGDRLINQNLDAIAQALSPAAVPQSILIQTMAFKNGWGALVGFQAPGYRIWPTGEIELFGGLTGGTSALAAFVLPFAPAAQRQWGAGSWDGTKPVAAMMKIDALGNVIPVVNSNVQVFLDGVRFVSGG